MLALLLAAGRGRRLGQPKAFVDLEGLTALERCCETLAAARPDTLRIVVASAGLERAEALAPAGAELVVNDDPDRGQTSSLILGLAAGPATDVFLHTVDHPLVRRADVERLSVAIQQRPPGAQIVVPSVDGRRGHPCFYAAPLVAEFLALADDEPAHRVLRADPTRISHVVLDDPWLVRDIDTPDELDAARRALRLRADGS